MGRTVHYLCIMSSVLGGRSITRTTESHESPCQHVVDARPRRPIVFSAATVARPPFLSRQSASPFSEPPSIEECTARERAARPSTTLTLANDMAGGLNNPLFSFSIMTDGLPDDSRLFVESLKELANIQNLGVLTCVLHTEDASVVGFYSGLDSQIGGVGSDMETTRFDVLDDRIAEEAEIVRAGNGGWFAYSLLIHVARMAGCNNPVPDGFDEARLAPHFKAKLVSELLSLKQAPHWKDNLPAFIIEVEKETNSLGEDKMVWSAYEQEMRPVVNASQLRHALRSEGAAAAAAAATGSQGNNGCCRIM